MIAFIVFYLFDFIEGCVNIHGQDVNFPTVQDVYAPTGYRHGVIDHKLEESSPQQCGESIKLSCTVPYIADNTYTELDVGC